MGTLTRVNAADVLAIADLFLIQELKVQCIDFMSKNMITLRDVIPTFGLAEAHSIEALQNHAADFISTNMDDLLRSEHFLEAEAADLAAVFRSDQVVYYDEVLAFDGLWRWIQHRPDVRLSLLDHLLPCIRLTLVTPSAIVNDILTTKMITDNEAALELVKETMTYHLSEGRVKSRQQALARLSQCKLGDRMSLQPRRGPSVQCSIVLGKNQANQQSKTLCYVPGDNRWNVLADAPFRVEITPSTIYFKGGLYVMGGELGKRVFRLSLDEPSPKWTEIASLNQTRATGCCVLYHKNELYVIGGSSSKRKKRSRQRPTIEKYDEAKNKWLLCDPLPAPCYRCDVVHLASDEVLLRTHEFSKNGQQVKDSIRYFYGSTITKLREERDGRLVEELSRISGPPPEQLDINLVNSINGQPTWEVTYGQRKDVARLPVPITFFTICNALITRRAIGSYGPKKEKMEKTEKPEKKSLRAKRSGSS